MTGTKAMSACSAMVLWLVLSAPAVAVIVDFEDLAAAAYNVGGTFNSNGVQFNVIGYNGVGSSVQVSKSGTPTNTFLFGGNSIGVDVAVPANIGYLAFDFRDQCSGCSTTGITVNGAASSPSVQLVDLNNTNVGGVHISLLPANLPNFNGRLVLHGAIASFSTGGTEYSIDNLAMLVPEPSSAAITMLTLGSLAGLRRRR